MELDVFQTFREKIKNNISKVIIGKDNEIDLVLVSFIVGGHILIEDVPGVGKTTLVKAFAQTIGVEFKRIQFTPDLLPSDITGINFYNTKTNEFEFKRGPIFSNIVLADEINRATPRTQSSLLEAMEERQVTIDGVTRKLEYPFMVLATQNPVESFGTFPLPEAQLDRFLMRISMGYPERNDEIEIINRFTKGYFEKGLDPVVSLEEINYVKDNFIKVKASSDILEYIMNIVEATRKNERIELGVSPRGTLALFKACQAYAALNGRDFLIPEDVKFLAPYVLNHRIITRHNTSDNFEFINSIIESITVPLEKF